jgi:hypothetical protein
MLHLAFSEQADARDMARVKTWLASAVLVGGAGGGAAAVIAMPGNSPQPAPAPAARAAAAPDAGYLQQQVDSLLREDHALKRAVSRARLRLAGQVHAGEQSLAVLHRRIIAAQNELARAQAAARTRATTVTVAAAPAPATTPASHATTGASGAGSGHGDDGEHEGGGDD